MILVMLILLCCACSNKDELQCCQPKQWETDDNPHAISKEQALSSLQKFIVSFDDGATRSAMQNRKIKEVYSVSFRKDETRAEKDNSIDCKNLLYVVNFDDNQGFAILAADDRVKDDVLAVVEQGNMSPVVMQAVASDRPLDFAYCHPVVSDFPTTGPGYIKADDGSDEVYLNPNTVDLTNTPNDDDNIDADTIVGNFDPDGAQVRLPVERENVGVKIPEEELRFDAEGETIGGLVYDKARNDLYENNDGDTAEKKSSSSDASRTVTLTSGWALVNGSTSLLVFARGWSQRSPFNDCYPTRRKFRIFGKKRKAYAGCFPLAIAKVLAMHKYPDVYKYNGTSVNWEELQKSFNSKVGSSSAACLLRGISEGCDSWYFYNGTFTRPKHAVSYLKKIGFMNVRKMDYRFGEVKSMIDKRFPVIIYACPRINVFKSHCWNIDGYKIMERTITNRTFSSANVLLDESEKKETRNMVHCDFGWQGDYNGYYVSGVFKLNDSSVQYDNSSFDPRESTHYNNFKHIITYEIPGR